MDVYLVALIVGGGLFALSLLGGHDGGLEHGLDAGHGGLGDLASWFSLRALVSFVAFFGLGGVVARLTGLGGAGQLAVALVTGLAVGGFTAFALRLARTRGELSSQVGRLAGRTGKVIVAPAPGRIGKVALTVAGQVVQAAARSNDALRAGDTVIVLGEEGGIVEVGAWDGA
jgi:membrane protein implicated in regulation of membrane protease activity